MLIVWDLNLKISFRICCYRYIYNILLHIITYYYILKTCIYEIYVLFYIYNIIENMYDRLSFPMLFPIIYKFFFINESTYIYLESLYSLNSDVLIEKSFLQNIHFYKRYKQLNWMFVILNYCSCNGIKGLITNLT